MQIVRKMAPSASAVMSSVWHSIGVSIAAIALLATEVAALEVRISPEDPQLGDTLSIISQPEDQNSPPPTAIVEGKAYPSYPIASGEYRALVPTTPLDKPGRLYFQVADKEQTRNMVVWVRDRRFPVQSIRLSPSVANLEATASERSQVRAFKALVTPEKFWQGAFQPPHRGRVTTVYGVRRYYNGVWAADYYHRGIDYAGATGSAVYAAAAGQVALVGKEAEGFALHGNTIGIDHGQGVTTIYLHLSRIDVEEGDRVRPGQVIGGVGSTGISTGPHLHWGLYVHGESVDPIPWLYGGIP